MIKNNQNLTNDFKYIKNMILNNKFNHDYIIDLATSYINNNPDNQVEKTELCAIMYELLPSNKATKYRDYLNTLSSIIKLKRDVALTYNPELEEKIGLGFIYAVMIYGECEKTLEYIAKEFIYIIFKEINIKDLINDEKFNKSKINTSLIKIIYLYDKELASYTSMHINVLESVKEEIFKEFDKTIKL